MIIPDGVVSLRKEFFRGGCITNELVLPETLKYIGSVREDWAFADTYLQKVILSSSLEMIQSFAFRNSVIELLVFPQKMLRCQCQGLISSLQAYGTIIMDWSIK